ncbi:MAG: hypothetical protein WCF57_05710, partial [Pyrinomonadaceae bacterium]
MTAVSKVRLYDLAKELKLDTKRLIEEVRREGVDVSVPSNSIPKELADKIRNKYFPKKEATAPRAVKVIKRPARPAVSEEAPFAEDEEMAAPALAAVGEQTTQPAPSDQGQALPQPAAPRVRKLTPATRAEQPSPPTGMPPGAATADPAPPQTGQEMAATDSAQTHAAQAPVIDVEAFTALAPAAAEQATEAQAPPPLASPTAPAEAPRRGATSSSPPPPAHQIRVLRPTAAALDAGIRHGERAPAPVPIAPPVAPVAPPT